MASLGNQSGLRCTYGPRFLFHGRACQSCSIVKARLVVQCNPIVHAAAEKFELDMTHSGFACNAHAPGKATEAPCSNRRSNLPKVVVVVVVWVGGWG